MNHRDYFVYSTAAVQHECLMMSRVCNHEHIVKFVGVVLPPHSSVVTTFMARGSVEDCLIRPGPKNSRFSTSLLQMLQMVVQAASGVLHLHAEGVIHRDLAARNLLVDDHGMVRVGDFGFSRVKDKNRDSQYTVSNIGPV